MKAFRGLGGSYKHTKDMEMIPCYLLSWKANIASSPESDIQIAGYSNQIPNRYMM